MSAEYGRTVEDGVVTIRVPEVWVLFNERGQAIGIRRGDTNWDTVYTPEAAHALFAKGRQLQHERLIGFEVRGMAWDAGHDLVRADMGDVSGMYPEVSA